MAMSSLANVGKVCARRGMGKMATRSMASEPWSYTPAGRNHLFVPGPTNINDKVLRAMMVQGQNHRDPSSAWMVDGLLKDLKYIFKTASAQPFIFPATGTGAWESALVNCLSPGDKVLAVRKGTFSHLWIEQSKKLGLDVTVLNVPWGHGADEAETAAPGDEGTAAKTRRAADGGARRNRSARPSGRGSPYRRV